MAQGKIKIVYLGRYNNEVSNGPEKFSKQLFNNVVLENDAEFIEYFFKDYKESNIIKRLFGKSIISVRPSVFRFGHITLLFYLLKTRPQIVHILTAERYTITVLLYKFIIGSKIVTTFHCVLKFEIPNNSQKRKELNRYRDYLWEWLALKFSDKTIFLTKSHLALAKKYYKIDRNKISIIPNGVEKEFYNKEKEIKIDGPLKIVFYNGNNDYIDRGLSEILRVLKDLDFQMRLYIIGNKINIKDAGLDIEFVNPMEKKLLRKFLVDKHVLLKSPSFDSFSIFSIECMAAGLIVVLSNKVGSSVYIKDGENGFVYDYNEPERIKDILRNIYYNKYNLYAISIRASQIINILSWENILAKYIKSYVDLLAK